MVPRASLREPKVAQMASGGYFLKLFGVDFNDFESKFKFKRPYAICAWQMSIQGLAISIHISTYEDQDQRTQQDHKDIMRSTIT